MSTDGAPAIHPELYAHVHPQPPLEGGLPQRIGKNCIQGLPLAVSGLRFLSVCSLATVGVGPFCGLLLSSGSAPILSLILEVDAPNLQKISHQGAFFSHRLLHTGWERLLFRREKRERRLKDDVRFTLTSGWRSRSGPPPRVICILRTVWSIRRNCRVWPSRRSGPIRGS